MNREIIKAYFGQEMLDALDNCVCPICKQPIDISDFTSTLEIKEFNISGMCKKCQDKLFH